MLLPKADSSIEYVLAYFIKERMEMFWNRVANNPPPYSADPIFRDFKFTNVYRVTDRVSQWLIRNVQYNQEWDNRNLIFRTILFKHFNSPSTWIGLTEYLGEEPTLENFNFEVYCKALDYCAESYPAVYNNAYMTAWVRDSDRKKAHGYLRLFAENIFNPAYGFIDNLLKCKSYNQVYNHILNQPYLGDFLSYQYATDLNYTPIWQFPENNLALATVGSKRGIEKLLAGARPRSHAEVIQFYVTYQDELLQAHGLRDGWVNLFGRPLQNIDIQNCFCELDKYLRVFKPLQKSAGGYQGKRIKNRFKKSTARPYALMFPIWWDIAEFNDKYTVH